MPFADQGGRVANAPSPKGDVLRLAEATREHQFVFLMKFRKSKALQRFAELLANGMLAKLAERTHGMAPKHAEHDARCMRLAQCENAKTQIIRGVTCLLQVMPTQIAL